MEHRNMPEATAGRDTERQMGKSTPANEGEHTRNKATKRKIPTTAKKEIAIYTKAPDRKKERGAKRKRRSYKETDAREKRQDEKILSLYGLLPGDT